MQRGQVGARKGYRRTDAELREMRARMDERVRELMGQGYAADTATTIARGEENARRDREVLERNVVEVIQDKMMGREVEGIEVSEEQVKRMDGDGWAIGEGGGRIPPSVQRQIDDRRAFIDEKEKAEGAEAREIAAKYVNEDGITEDGRRRMPTLGVTWEDADASGKGEKEWDRIGDESEAWYQAFMVYLHMPPLERGVGAAYRNWSKLVGRMRPPKTTPLEWYKAAQKYGWEVRSLAYDKTKTQRFVEKMETAEKQIEDELRDALMTALRKAVQRLKTGRLEEMSMTSAADMIPRLTAEIRKQFRMEQDNRVTLDAIMQALPVSFRQQVLLAVNIGTVAIDGRGIERSYLGKQMRSHPLADLTLKDRGLEKELKELEEIEGMLKPEGEQTDEQASEQVDEQEELA